MKNVFIRIGFIFAAITVAVLLVYIFICLSTFFIFNFVDIPVIAYVAYGIASAVSIAIIAFVFRDVKKTLVSLGIWAGASLVIAAIYIVIANWGDFKERMSSMISSDFAVGFLIAVVFMGLSVLFNHLFFDKKSSNNK